MQEYYKTLRHLDMDSKHIAAAVTEGAFAGSRLLLAGGTILWESAVLDHTLQQPAQALPEYEALKKELAAQFWKLPGCGIYQSCSGSVYCEALGREKKACDLRRRTRIDSTDSDLPHDGISCDRTGRPSEIRRQRKAGRGLRGLL